MARPLVKRSESNRVPPAPHLGAHAGVWPTLEERGPGALAEIDVDRGDRVRPHVRAASYNRRPKRRVVAPDLRSALSRSATTLVSYWPGSTEIEESKVNCRSCDSECHFRRRFGPNEASVGDLAETMGERTSTTSEGLRRLRDVGLVASRREGKHKYYVADSHTAELVSNSLSHATEDEFGIDLFPDGVRHRSGYRPFKRAQVMEEKRYSVEPPSAGPWDRDRNRHKSHRSRRHDRPLEGRRNQFAQALKATVEFE